jgi:lipopolysaccharide heptosyltransferase I
MTWMPDATRHRLLVIRLSALGDVIHTIPAVVALQNALPGTEIAWVVESAYAELVEIVVRPYRVVRFTRVKKLLAARHASRTARELREFARGHTSVDFQGLIKSSILGAISGARERYGFDRDAIRERPALLFVNHRAKVDRSRHVVEWNLDLARAVAPGIASVPEVDFKPFAADVGDAALARKIILLPGAGKPAKQWPTARFHEIARRLGDRALIVWGPGEESLAPDVAQDTGAAVAPRTNLRELARILNDATLVIGGDTGPLHLAAALGTPVLGLYGPTNPKRNGPYGQLNRCIDAYATTRSISSITVDDVLGRI